MVKTNPLSSQTWACPCLDTPRRPRHLPWKEPPRPPPELVGHHRPAPVYSTKAAMVSWASMVHHDPPQKLLALLLVASLATSSFLLLVVMPLATSSVLLFLPFLFRSAPWRRCLSQKAWRTREGASPKQLLQPNGFHPAPWRATSNVPKGCSYSQEYDTYRYTDTYGSGSKPGPLNPCYSVHVPWSTPLVDFGDATLSCSSLAAMLCVCSSAKGPKPQRSLVELEIQRRSLDTKPGSQLLQPP